MSTHPRSIANHARRGTVYVIVLATVLLAFVMAVSGLLAIGVQASSVRARSDADQARALAYAGLQSVVQQCSDSFTWRASVRTTPTQTLTLGGGKAVLTFTNASASNFVSLDQPVSLTSEGTYGAARFRLAATLNPSYAALDCMGVALCSGGTIAAYNSAVKSNGIAWANTSIGLSSTTLAMSAFTAGAATGSTYTPAATAGAGTKTIPDAATALDYYKSVGSAVTISTSVTYDGRLIAPAINPFGVAGQTDGIYAINCNGKPVTFQRGRVFGTLVFYNNTARVTITGSNCMSPANPALPLILTDGDLTISTSTAQLDESVDNLNPAGVPYNGVTNGTRTDTLAAELTGLIYAAGKITIKGGLTLNGQIIAGSDITLGTSSSKSLYLTLRYVPMPVAPPGFRVPPGFCILPSSIVRSVDE